MTIAKMKFILVCAGVLLGTTAANALGVVNGGGGKGVVCRDSNHKVVKPVETLDLWEARELHNLVPAGLSGNLAADVDTALVRLKNSLRFANSESNTADGPKVCRDEECTLLDLRDAAKPFLDPTDVSIVRLHNIKLEATKDALELIQPQNCEIEQIVNYPADDNEILLNQDLFDQMDEANQVALIIHESYYRFLRNYFAEENSLRVRRAVGFVLSGTDLVSPPKMAWQKGQIICQTPEVQNTSGDSVGHNTPTNVLIFSGEMKKVDFLIIRGTPLIGISASLQDSMNASYVKKIFRDNDCPGFSTYMNFDGPIEYDRQIRFTRICRNGRSIINFSVRNPGEAQALTQSLTCRSLNKPHQW